LHLLITSSQVRILGPFGGEWTPQEIALMATA
jgi:hypothetical protein